LPDPKLDNLKRWIDSKEADAWVESHSGVWSYSEWMAFLEELKAGAYWPMPLDDVESHLESLTRKYRDVHTQILAGADETALRPAMRWYVAGLAVVGLATGFFAGASHTPIIGTLLPLLFALIGGTSGVYIANADLSSPAFSARMRWLGRSLGAFGLACLLGSSAGISLRLHYEHPRREELITLWHGKAQAAIQLAALRTKLELLGVSSEERERVLAAAAAALDEAERPVDGRHVRELAGQARQLEAELKALRHKAGASHSHIPEDADSLITQLDFFCHQTEPWADSGMPRDLFKNSVETVWFHLSHIAMPKDAETAAFVHQTGFDTQNLDKLFTALHAEFRLRDDLDWELGGATAERLDRFLQWESKVTKPPQDAEEVMPAIGMDTKSEKSTPTKKDDRKEP